VSIALISSGATSGLCGQRLTAPSFVFARYATRSASAIYATHGFGSLGAVIALVENPRTKYRELIGGVYTQFNSGHQSMIVALAYADASDARYIQTYLNPSITAGSILLSTTVEWYAPVDRAGTQQLSFNPLSVEWQLSHKLALGVTGTLDVAPRTAPAHRVGPVAEWATGWGTLRLEVLKRMTGPTELRMGVVAAR
jgi:hypothetical protein